MSTSVSVARRGLLALALAAVWAVLVAGPASAHAELVSSTPADGERLDSAPAEVQMTFTESVNLLDGGIRLVDSSGDTVPTEEPTADGVTVTVPMPSDLPDGAYVLDWRLVSSDGHPVQGAFAFGVGTAATAVGAAPDTATAPWPVVTARYAGYLAFALLAGVLAFVVWCAPASKTNPSVQLLARVGMVGGLVATAAGLLVQGPYVAGLGPGRLFDLALLQGTLTTPFGAAMVWRIALYGALAVLAWRLAWLDEGVARWLVPFGVVALSVTVAAAGHGAATGSKLDLAVVAAHALTAGVWVGGLTVLVVLGRSLERRAVQQFSRLAMTSVLVLVATGTLNSLQHLDAVRQLWDTRYGVILLVKLGLVGTTLVAAAWSRRRLRSDQVPLRSVRVEAGLTAVVLAVTAVLSLTTPPSRTGGQDAGAAAAGTDAATTDSTVRMSLGSGRTAQLQVRPATTAGSRLELLLFEPDGLPLEATRVDLKVSNEENDLGPFRVPVTGRADSWVAEYRFPLPGTWKVTLTVEDATRSAVVTAGEVEIS
jgi:copper transport protein